MKKVFQFIIIGVFFSCLIVRADSGWDYSYDSYDSSSYSDYDVSSDRDSTSSGGRFSRSSYVTPGIVSVLVAVILVVTSRRKKKKRGGFIPEDNNKAEDVVIEHGIERERDNIELLDSNFDMVIQKYLPDSSEEELLNDFYHIFVEIQTAWMNFDYVTLEKYCSKELYESYHSDLEALKKKHCKNVMRDFRLESSAIRGIEEVNHKVVVDMYLYVSFIDYVINEETFEVIRGVKDKVSRVSYDLEFVMDLEGVENCPSCGASLTSRVCDACGSVVNYMKDSFVLNQKGIMRK